MKRFSKITTTQLARICGVSQGTVDRALHGRKGINPGTRDKILEVAREYDYRPTVRASEDGRSMLIGVVLFDLYNEFFSKLAMSLVSEARKFGYSIIFQFSGKDEKNEHSALQYFDFIGVDGIILFSVGSDSEDYGNYLASLKKPIVLIGNRLFSLPFIGVDDDAAMSEVTERLIKSVTSKKDIIYFAPALKKGLHSDNAQRHRAEAFVKTAKALRKSYRIATELSELSDFGGIVCAADCYMLSALKHLDYPRDIKISGFDNIYALGELEARVMSVEYSTDKIAEECINYILGRPYAPKIAHCVVYNRE